MNFFQDQYIHTYTYCPYQSQITPAQINMLQHGILSVP